MKNIEKLLITIGIFLTVFAGCNKEDSYEVIEVEYTKCPCDHETDFIKSVTLENVLLFDSTKTTLNKMKELSFDGICSNFFCYSPETDTIVYYSICKPYSNNITITHIAYFCNFPIIVEEWDIPINGFYLSFSADVYNSCNSPPGINQSYSDNILTSLKKLK